MTPGSDWTSLVPAMAVLDPATRQRLRGLTRPVVAPAGARIFGEGSPCEAYLILLSGQLRVCKVGESGREIGVVPGRTRRDLRRHHRLSDGWHAV